MSNNSTYIELALEEGNGDILKGFRKLKKRYNPETSDSGDEEIYEAVVASETYYKEKKNDISIKNSKESNEKIKEILDLDKPETIKDVIETILIENLSLLYFWKK